MQILHRSLSSENILIGSEFFLKLTGMHTTPSQHHATPFRTLKRTASVSGEEEQMGGRKEGWGGGGRGEGLGLQEAMAGRISLGEEGKWGEVAVRRRGSIV